MEKAGIYTDADRLLGNCFLKGNATVLSDICVVGNTDLGKFS